MVARAILDETTEDFTDIENVRLRGFYIAWVSHLENTFFQREAGVIDEDVFEAYGWNAAPIHSAHFRELSEGVLAGGTSRSFADFFLNWMADYSNSTDP